MKIQELAAAVGGIIKNVVLIFSVILFYLNRNSLSDQIAKKFCNFYPDVYKQEQNASVSIINKPTESNNFLVNSGSFPNKGKLINNMNKEDYIADSISASYKNKNRSSNLNISFLMIRLAFGSIWCCKYGRHNEDKLFQKFIKKARKYVRNFLNIENYISLTHRVENIRDIISVKDGQTKYELIGLK